MDPQVLAAWIGGAFLIIAAVMTALLKRDIIIVLGAFRWRQRVPPGFVVLINGGSGVGKTTIAWALARKLNIASVFGSDFAREVLRDRILPAQPPEQRTLLRSSFEAYQEMGLLPRTTQGTINGFLTQSTAMLNALVRVINRIRTKRDPVIIEGVNIVPSQLFNEIPNDVRSKVFLINLYLSSADAHLKRIRERGIKAAEPDPFTERYIRNIDPIRDIDSHLRTDTVSFVLNLPGIPPNVVSLDNSGNLHTAVDKLGSAIIKRVKWLKEQGIE